MVHARGGVIASGTMPAFAELFTGLPVAALVLTVGVVNATPHGRMCTGAVASKYTLR